MDQSLSKIVFGRLTWESIPLHEPILLGTFIVVVLGGLAILAAVTKYSFGATSGKSGSLRSTTRRSGSCT
jgi:hypothetical protein